jgi:hypothetical protein
MRTSSREQEFAERIAALEREVSALRAEIERSRQPNDWISAIGRWSSDNEAMKQIDEAGRKIREADRERARRAEARAEARAAARKKASKGRQRAKS